MAFLVIPAQAGIQEHQHGLRARRGINASTGAVAAPLSSWPAKAGHPRLSFMPPAKTWMAGPSPAMTMRQEPRPDMIPLFRSGSLVDLQRAPVTDIIARAKKQTD